MQSDDCRPPTSLEFLVMTHLRFAVAALAILAIGWLAGSHFAVGQNAPAGPQLKKWKQSVGWGWVWGPGDEIGAMNELTNESRAAALKLATTGKVYDLGVTYSRRSFKWPGHAPGEIMSFRSPGGESAQKDVPVVGEDINPSRTRWHSNAMFMSDNVATQIDSFGHITLGDDKHWYNGYKEEEFGGDFGIMKCDASKIPPIIARGVMLDIAAARNVEELPEHYAITPADIDAATARQKVKLQPGGVVLIRTGTLRHWGNDGDNHAKINEHDSAGITLETARYLVEQHGSLLIGSDTSGLEVNPAAMGSKSFIPVHTYLLVEQGVHIGEFHYLEDLARDKTYEFCYVCTVNKIQGATAGFCLRPLALR
jgi:kynurenine formamidase